MAITIDSAIGISVAVGIDTKDASADLTNNALSGVAVGLLLIGVLGVLVMTGEYGSGVIRSTLTAIRTGGCYSRRRRPCSAQWH